MSNEKQRIISKLESLGWRQCPGYESRQATLYKRYPSRHRCQCNDNKDGMQICVSVWDEMADMTTPSIEVGIVGELPDGVWVNFKVYGLRGDELFERLDGIITMLVETWDNAAYTAFIRRKAR